MFDYGVGTHRRKEDFWTKKDVMYLLSYICKGMSKIIITIEK